MNFLTWFVPTIFLTQKIPKSQKFEKNFVLKNSKIVLKIQRYCVEKIRVKNTKISCLKYKNFLVKVQKFCVKKFVLKNRKLSVKK